VEEGYDVVVAARRVDRLEALAAETGARPSPATVTDDRSVADPGPDGRRLPVLLVANAGGAFGSEPIETADVADWQAMYDVNVLGTLRVVQALLPALERSLAGHVVLMGSIAGRLVYEGGAGYTGVKHALPRWARRCGWSSTAGPVRVSEIAPGMVATEEFSLVRFRGDAERRRPSTRAWSRR
jgi:NADP-dependent 3-hydroxy acid dehydrogenase YdfG